MRPAQPARPVAVLSIFAITLAAACGSSAGDDSTPTVDTGDGGPASNVDGSTNKGKPGEGVDSSVPGDKTGQGEGGAPRADAGHDGAVDPGKPGKDAGAADALSSHDAANTSDAAHADAGQSVGPYPAFPFDPPTLKTHGGAVLANPKIVSITFGNDPLADQIDDFVVKIASSSYWAATTSEYGVGPLRPSKTVRIPTAPATSSESKIQSFLTQNMGGVLGPFDPQAIYTIFYPATTTVSGGACVSNLGHHYEIPNGSAGPIVYAVVPECPMVQEGNGTLLDEITDVAGHELTEAATDPFPNSDPAYQFVDDAHVAWEMALAGENGDLCVQAHLDAGDRPADLGYFVQRTWSNLSAAANHNPCVPISSTITQGTTYFTAVPVLPNTFTLNANGRRATTKGVTLPATIDLHLSSDAPMAPWTLLARDDNEFNGDPAHLDFVFSSTTGSNGETVKLTITPKAGVRAVTGFFVVGSKNLATQEQNLAPIAFKVP